MNPGEQDQNPFRRPGSISGSQNSASINRSRYFGARSRYQSNHSQNTTVPNPQGFVNPFSQQQQQPQPQYVTLTQAPARRSHKKRNLIIAGSIAAIVLIVTAVIVTTVTIANGGMLLKGTNHNLADLQATIEKYRDRFRESWLQNESVREYTHSFPRYSKNLEENEKAIKEYENKRDENVNAILKFSEELDQFGDIDIKNSNYEDYDINHDLKFLKNVVKKIADFEKKYINIQIAIINIFNEDASEQSINNLKNITDNENLRKLSETVKNQFRNLTKTEVSQQINELYNQVLLDISIDIGEETEPNLILSRISKIRIGEQNENQ